MKITFLNEQGTVALWFNALALDRKIEGSNLAANSFASERPLTRETKQIGNENKKKRARERPLLFNAFSSLHTATAWMQGNLESKLAAHGTKQLELCGGQVGSEKLTKK